MKLCLFLNIYRESSSADNLGCGIAELIRNLRPCCSINIIHPEHCSGLHILYTINPIFHSLTPCFFSFQGPAAVCHTVPNRIQPQPALVAPQFDNSELRCYQNHYLPAAYMQFHAPEDESRSWSFCMYLKCFFVILILLNGITSNRPYLNLTQIYPAAFKALTHFFPFLLIGFTHRVISLPF